MRKSVEHLGPQHETQDIMVAPGMIMRVCPEFELRRYRFMEGLLGEHGRLFDSARPYPLGLPRYPIGGRCYDQAAAVAQNTDLIYCEGVLLIGLMTGGFFPMPHAWCCTPDGTVVDPTCWSFQSRENIRYLGVPIQKRYVEWWEQEYGFHGLLDGHPELGDSVGVYADPVTMWKEVLG